jgi:23S rRNA (guanosine2251-2'-O)-methyltransferase
MPKRPPPHHPPRPAAQTRAQPSGQVRPAAPPAGESGPWLWGRHAVLAALANPERKLLRLIATAETAAELAGTEHEARLQILPKEELQRLLPPGAVHQGLALMAKPLRQPVLEDLIDGLEDRKDVVLVALDQVTDPHNIGAIMRSAAGFGASGLMLPDRNAPEISGTLAKSASGAVEHLPLIRVINLNRSLDQLKAKGFWIVGLEGEAEKKLSELKLDGRVCLVLGAEGHGLRRLTRESCDLMARLPTGGPIASLNVSNAAAIALYEIARNK